MEPLVTVRVITYKHAAYIGAALDAILAQTYRNLQILILDDASPDETAAIVGRYQDPRIQYIRRERNLGLVGNFNAGLPLAKGDFVWGVAGDDHLLCNTTVAAAVHEFHKNPDLGFIFGRPVSNSQSHAQMFDWGSDDKILLGPELARECISRNPICAGTVMAKGDLYRQYGSFPDPFLYAGDWYFWFLFALHSKRVLYRPQHKIFYRYHEANLTTQFFSEKQPDRMVQQIQLRLAMLELTQGMEGFKEPIMTALRKAVHGLLDFWMNRPSSRHEIWQQLGRRWELDEVPRAEVNLSGILSAVLTEEGRAMVSKALRQRRPLYFLRALQLQAALPGLRRVAVPTPE